MKDNIFANAYFGKAYKTRNGKKAIYITCEDKDFNSHPHILGQEDTKKYHCHNDFGQVLVKYDELESEMYDIVSEWKEPIDEKKLDELAKSTLQYDDGDKFLYKHPNEYYTVDDLDIAFKAGYRKALENKL